MKNIWQLPIINDQTESDLQIYMDTTGTVNVKSNGKFFAPIHDARKLAVGILNALDQHKMKHRFPVYAECPRCKNDYNVRHIGCGCGYRHKPMSDFEWLDAQRVLLERLQFDKNAVCLTESHGEVHAHCKGRTKWKQH